MSIDSSAVKKLRDMTGAGIVDCKNALIESNMDVSRACEILMKKGILKADKYTSKEARLGAIGSYSHHGRICAMVELNCETDFVARNDEFNELLHDICLHVVGVKPFAVGRDDLSPDFVKQQEEIIREQLKDAIEKKPPEIQKKMIEGKLLKDVIKSKCLLEQDFVNPDKFKGTVSDYIKSKSGKFGENIRVSRFAIFELGKETQFAETKEANSACLPESPQKERGRPANA